MNDGSSFDLETAASSIGKALSGDVSSLRSVLSSLKGKLSSVNDYDGMNLSSNADTLASNFSNKIDDLETILTNMQNYVKGEIEIDGTTIFNSTGVPYESLFQTDGSRDGNARAIWNFLKYKGLSDAAAAGVLGNIQAESGFRPDAIEIATGEGHGLIQWSFGRRQSLLAAAQAQGVDWRDLQFQLEYLWNESLDPNSSYGQRLKSAGFYNDNISPSDAAYLFHNIVEGSNDSKAAILNNRCATADQWYNTLKGTSAGDVNAKISSSAHSIIPQATGTITGVSSGTGAYYSSGGYTNYGSGGSGSVARSFELSTADRNVKIDNVDYDALEKALEDIRGVAVDVPDGLGSVHAYMGWQCITSRSSDQYKLIQSAGMNFDENGFGMIGDRYVVATTTTFGNVGDFIDVVQEDGTIIKCIIGDIKNQNDAGCNKWGHNNGQCVVEFVVDKSSWYGTNKTVNGYHPEWKQNVDKIINKGNYFELANKYKKS